ncbi:hypothetical protein TIFTF001_029864 [Ficus carica]|uniref:Uncharacterized protein n=1 Tax=Ficus carica TaxID=3494 RepID=A0AA88DS98_FICCA|nr:hypothetical protein TIFTF001_029864 [Ficus carica]
MENSPLTNSKLGNYGFNSLDTLSSTTKSTSTSFPGPTYAASDLKKLTTSSEGSTKSITVITLAHDHSSTKS